MIMRIAITAFLLTLFFSFPAGADSDQGRADFLAGLALEYRAEEAPDFRGALVHYQAAARAGSREALLALVRLGQPGGPLEESPDIWRDRLQAAAEAGWVEAAFTLAEALEKALVRSETLKAGDFYYQAALAGHPEAALRLGELYLSLNDEANGAMWLTVAAENNNAQAALTLGRLYYDRNPKAAGRWLEKAEGPEAFHLLGEMYLKEKRFVEAVNAFTVSADQNYAPAHLSLGLIDLGNDFGRKSNVRQALKHFKAAAQAGLPEGAYQLAQMYLAGQATPKDSITGAYWLHRAAGQGHEKARDEYEKLTYNFTVGQKKRLDRMIGEDILSRDQHEPN